MADKKKGWPIGQRCDDMARDLVRPVAFSDKAKRENQEARIKASKK